MTHLIQSVPFDSEKINVKTPFKNTYFVNEKINKHFVIELQLQY